MTFLFFFSTELRDGDLQTLCQILKTHDYLWTKRMEVEAIGVTCGYGVSIFCTSQISDSVEQSCGKEQKVSAFSIRFT